MGDEAAVAVETTSAPETVAPSTDAVTAPEATATPAELYTLKVNGREEQVSRDELIARAQKASAADEKFEAAASARKEIERLAPLASKVESDAMIRAYLEGDEATFYELLAERLEYDNLPPEEKAKVDERRELQRKAKLGEEVERKRAEESQAAQIQADVRELGAIATRELVRVGIAPDSPDYAHAVERWAAELYSAAEAGVKLSPAQAAERVRDWMGRASSSALQSLGSLEGDDLLAKLDELGITERFRRADAARLSKRLGKPPPESAVAKPNGERKAKRKIGAGDMRALLFGIGDGD